jgi:hypothetical protein
MSQSDDAVSERTYRAIGRFIFEFSQAEYSIRHYLAEEIGLDDKFFSAVVGSYDVAMLCKVALAVFNATGEGEEKRGTLPPRPDYLGDYVPDAMTIPEGDRRRRIKDLIKDFLQLNDNRIRVVHGLWVPFKEGGTVHHVPRSSLKPIESANQAANLEKLADEANRIRFEFERAVSSLPDA